MRPIEPIQRESRWKKWNRTARRIRAVHRQHGVRHCRSAVGFGSRCLALVWKKESLELASRWKQPFAPSTHNTWLDYVPLSELFFTRADIANAFPVSSPGEFPT